ncbi:hypothetical protein FGIG_09812 [Fasciola gigantica]|uniref:Uncharacterized protein n=1 Tax=Fasciola gigantica TaxID=46835 RepID=A0A504YAL8_FASGI|nr:hypothetical protein FGIG_09812 [Fasciola gigantica]
MNNIIVALDTTGRKMSFTIQYLCATQLLGNLVTTVWQQLQVIQDTYGTLLSTDWLIPTNDLGPVAIKAVPNWPFNTTSMIRPNFVIVFTLFTLQGFVVGECYLDCKNGRTPDWIKIEVYPHVADI